MIEKILFYLPTILSVVAFLISLICFIVKSIKTKNCGNFVNLAKVVQKLPGYINEAEVVCAGDKLGVLKLNYVLNKAHFDCITYGIQFDEAGIKGEIENILSTPHKKEI